MFPSFELYCHHCLHSVKLSYYKWTVLRYEYKIRKIEADVEMWDGELTNAIRNESDPEIVLFMLCQVKKEEEKVKGKYACLKNRLDSYLERLNQENSDFP